MKKESCYKCDAERTSKEHVPPQCIFPKSKDTNGINFRKDLITVPSCAKHNSEKSDDDEFLMLSLVGLINNSTEGKLIFSTSANRSIKRKGLKFLYKHILRNHKFGVINHNGVKKKVSIGEPDVERLNVCFENIAYGLYYHKFGERFEGESRILYGFLTYKDKTTETLKEYLEEILKTRNFITEGSNPSVFQFMFIDDEIDGILALKMIFYGNAIVYYSFKPKDKEIFNLNMQLIKDGYSTEININDKVFNFN